MLSSRTPADHIFLLARRGDPSAFYFLFGQELRNVYREAREAGCSHLDAKNRTITFSIKIYRSFTSSPSRCAPDLWLQGMKKKFPLQPRVLDIAVAQPVSAAEMEEFDSALQMSLQRQYCERRRLDARIENVLHVRRFMVLHPALRIPIYGALLAAVAAAAVLYLHLSSSRISLTLSSPFQQQSLIIAPDPHQFINIRFESRTVGEAWRLPAVQRPSLPMPARSQQASRAQSSVTSRHRD